MPLSTILPEHAQVAESIVHELKSDNIQSDAEWGIDHASWAVLTHMYPNADIPIFEMSLDVLKNEKEHYALVKNFHFFAEKTFSLLAAAILSTTCAKSTSMSMQSRSRGQSSSMIISKTRFFERP